MMDFVTANNSNRTAEATEALLEELAYLRFEINKAKTPKWYHLAALVASIVAALASLVSAVK